MFPRPLYGWEVFWSIKSGSLSTMSVRMHEDCEPRVKKIKQNQSDGNEQVDFSRQMHAMHNGFEQTTKDTKWC